MSQESQFIKDFRDLLSKHNIAAPRFAYGASAFDAEKPRMLYAGPMYNQEEIVAGVSALVEGKWFVAGEHVQKFERLFSQYIGVKDSVMVNSGSSADLLMIAAAKQRYGWKDGDGILVSPAGFPTTVSAITLNGLRPIFVDIEWETLNADNSLIERTLRDALLCPEKDGLIGDFGYKQEADGYKYRICWNGPKEWIKLYPVIRAILVSPVLGNPPDMDQLVSLAEKYNVKLLLDGCDSLGSTWRGKPLATYAAASTCSFFPSHHISCGQGGMVSSDDKELIDIVLSMASWGKGCFPSGTQINCAEGYKEIQDIKVGDVVVSHLGQHRKVIDTFERPYTGRMVTIQGRLINRVQATANHLFYIEREGVRQWIRADQLIKKDILLEAIPLETITPKSFSWSYKTDGIGMLREHTLDICPDLMRLIGYWLAEGCLAKSLKGQSGYKTNKHYAYRVEFSFNITETTYHQDVLALMKRFFGATGWTQRKEGQNSLQILFKSRKAYEFFFAHFGCKAWAKSLPNDMVGWDTSLLLQLVKGFHAGDGSSNWQGKQLGSTSYTLFNQIRRILIRVGVFGSMTIRKPEDHSSSVVNGRLVEAKHPYYSLCIYGTHAERLDALVLGEGYKSPTEHVYAWLSEDGLYACYPVYTIESEDVVNVPVYNMSVETDNSYHANNIAVHNCWCTGAGNMLPNGCCGKRFSNWLPLLPESIVDHRYVFTTDRAYNLRPLDIQGAFGCIQMEKIDAIHEARRRAYIQIDAIMYEAGIQTASRLSQANPSWFGYPIICPSYTYKRAFIDHLEKNGVQTREYFAGNLLLQPGYSHLGKAEDYPNAQQVLQRVFFIGTAPFYTDDHFNHLEKVVKSFASLV